VFQHFSFFDSLAPVLLLGLGIMRRPPAISYLDSAELVTLEIDLAPADIPPIDVAPAKASPVEVPSPDVARPVKKILLLEDRDDFQEVLCEHLASRSFQITSVPSGVEGLRAISKDAFDLIVCDMMMPQMGGEMFYWAVTRIRPAFAQRFIFFTGHQNNSAIEFFFKRVKATVLIKPFKLAELDAKIDDALRRLL
jgi:CheY-like chemotaxis protein